MLRTLGWLLVAAAVAGCSALWSVANRRGLEADLREVLGAYLDVQPEMDCAMVGTTRTGYCLFDAQAESVRDLAEEMGMEARAVDLHDPGSLPPLQVEGRVGCLSAEVFGQVQGLPAYWLGGRPDALALQSGGRFEYLLLVFDPAAGRACALASYAYG